jgi:GDPmannose 4,6-dehydratase
MDWNEFVGFDQKYERPAEVDLLIGNPQKAKNQLGWEPKTTFKDLVSLMVEEDMKIAKQEQALAQANLG